MTKTIKKECKHDWLFLVKWSERFDNFYSYRFYCTKCLELKDIKDR
jgi:hypothetical protein